MNAQMPMPEFVVCSEKPQVSECNGRYILFFTRNPQLTIGFADKNKQITAWIAERTQHPPTEKPAGPEWTLPEDEHSRIIEYYGVPSHYSRIRFAMMKLLIEADGKPVPFSQVAKKGWGYHVDRTIIEKNVYSLNLHLDKLGIPRAVHTGDETIYMDSDMFGRLKRPGKCPDEMQSES